MLQFIKTFDVNTIDFINNHLQYPFLNKIMAFITALGNSGLFWIVLTIALIISKKYRKIGLLAACSLLLSSIIGLKIFKPLFQRPRPFIEFSYIKPYIPKLTSYSFPSGHATIAFSVAGIIVKMVKQKIYSIPIIILACLVAISRVYLMVHYPSDVIAGIILGLICSYLVLLIFKKIQSRRLKEKQQQKI